MSTPELADYKRLNDEREQVIKSSDLPLHCPVDDAAIWCAHPKVYLYVYEEDRYVMAGRCESLCLIVPPHSKPAPYNIFI